MKKFFNTLFLLMFTCVLFAQHEEGSHEKPHAEEHEAAHHMSEKKNRIAPIMGYTYVSRGLDVHGKKVGQLVPTFGLDYQRQLSPRFAIGFFNDVELNSYTIEEKEGKELEREYAFVSTLVGIYEASHGWTLIAGFGREFEAHESFHVVRLATEYEVPIRNEWDVAFGFSYDYKEIYNTFAFSIAFGKRF